MSIKISALPTVTSVDNADVFPFNASGVTSKILFSALKTALNYQPLNANLTALAAASAPSSMGLGFLSSTTPTVASYALIGSANTVSYQTAAQVVAYLRANGLGVDTTTAQLLTSKIINGITFQSGTAATPDTITTGLDTPSDTFLVRYTKVGGFTGGTIDLQFQGTTKATFPKGTYVVATVAGVRDTSDDTKASASTVNLDAADGTQVDISGAVTISAFTLAESVERTIKFTGAPLLDNNPSLLLPTGADIQAAVGDYAVLKGGAGGIVSVLEYKKSDAKLYFGGDVWIGDDFTTGGIVTLSAGSAGSTLNIFGTSNNSAVTLPGGTHTLAAEVLNYISGVQSIPAATRTYIDGSAVTVPDSKIQRGTIFSWKFNMTKTAAGSAASTFDICIGTLGTTGDTARLSFTKPAGTAAVDEGFVTIEAIVRGPTLSAAIVSGQFNMIHNLASTGHMTIPCASVHTNSSGVNLTTAGLIVGVCVTTGASDDITIEQVSAQAFKL